MGGLVRCDGCGALRWSLLRARAGDAPPNCEICGEPLKPERRRPGRRFGKPMGRERRDLAAPGSAADRAPGPLAKL